jgi:hypothetical protein
MNLREHAKRLRAIKRGKNALLNLKMVLYHYRLARHCLAIWKHLRQGYPVICSKTITVKTEIPREISLNERVN